MRTTEKYITSFQALSRINKSKKILIYLSHLKKILPLEWLYNMILDNKHIISEKHLSSLYRYLLDILVEIDKNKVSTIEKWIQDYKQLEQKHTQQEVDENEKLENLFAL